MTTKPVVVYGASGYTGRLVCEYLREYNVPFIAAGRDKARIAEAMDKVPGIDTVEHDIVEVSHDVEPLSELFDGAKVVLNTVGPFAQYGREVVEACIAAGCHYLDTTGEQDWLITCDEEYGGRMAAEGLLLAPGIAQMYTTSEIAAQLCLEKPGRRHARHPGLLEGHADGGLHPDHPGQRVPVQGVLPGAEPVRGMARRRRPVRRGDPGPARDRPGPAVGRHVASGVVQARPAGGQRQGAGRRVQPPAHARRPADRQGRRWRRSRACRTARSSG